MNKKWLIIAGITILTGGLLFVGTMTAFGWDFSKLDSRVFETNVVETNENFQSIVIESDEASINLLPYEGEKTKIVLFENASKKHTVTVENGTLTVKKGKTQQWYEYIQPFSFKKSTVTIYLPQANYTSTLQDLQLSVSTSDLTLSDISAKSILISVSTGDIRLENVSAEQISVTASTGDIQIARSEAAGIHLQASTGDISVKNLTAAELSIQTSTGDICASLVRCDGLFKATVTSGDTSLTDVTCANLQTVGNTGSLNMTGVIASESFSIERSTGSVSFTSCDAAEITVTTSTGDVTGTLLSDKVIFPDSSTGEVEVPKSATGGRCEIKTTTGDIKIQIAPN